MKLEYYVMEANGYTIFIHYDAGKEPFLNLLEKILVELVESGHYFNLRGPYSARKEGPHTSNSQHHIHLLKNGTELFAVNKDGSSHDGSKGFTIPKKAFDAIRQHQAFRGWNIKQTIESVSILRELQLILNEISAMELYE